MAKNKNITPANVTEWLASTGFLFPTNELELFRFNKLHGDLDEQLTGKEIDPERILSGLTSSKIIKMNVTQTSEQEFSSYKMVARNGNNLPKHILEKMKKIKRTQSQMITTLRKKKISELAHYVASQFYHSNTTDLEAIAKFEGLKYYYDHYEEFSYSYKY